MSASPAVPDDRDSRFAGLWDAWQGSASDAELRDALHMLARESHAPAMCALAELSFSGRHAPRDPAAAWMWAIRSAHLGFAAAAAMAGDFLLHAEPEHGAGIRLPHLALRWHEAAADAGHAHAALAASDSHRMGRGCERDFAKAYEYLLIAVACFESPPPMTEILAPSLRTDLDEEQVRSIEARAQERLTALPRADATLEGYWATLAGDSQG